MIAFYLSFSFVFPVCPCLVIKSSSEIEWSLSFVDTFKSILSFYSFFLYFTSGFFIFCYPSLESNMSLPHFLLAQAKEVLNETLATPTNATASTPTPSSKEGRTCAYIALVVMAVVPILIGSKKSVKSLNTQKEKQKVILIQYSQLFSIAKV